MRDTRRLHGRGSPLCAAVGLTVATVGSLAFAVSGALWLGRDTPGPWSWPAWTLYLVLGGGVLVMAWCAIARVIADERAARERTAWLDLARQVRRG